ncbi:MAG: hypothetical protein AB7H88_13445, partial [Vicinamibacterales bacterium]
ALFLASAAPARAQAVATPDACRAALLETFQPLLPYPAATEANTPADGSADPQWIVRRPGADEAPVVIEVIANPYNVDNQLQAERDMASIRAAVFGAERRAQAEYERLVEESRRTGRGRDLAGITLDDEGVAGERADGEAHLEVVCLAGVTTAALGSSAAPVVERGVAGGWVVSVPANEYREVDPDGGGRARYRPAEWRLYLGADGPPIVSRRQSLDLYDITVRGRATSAARPAGLTIVLRGNEALLADLARDADWTRLARLVP